MTAKTSAHYQRQLRERLRERGLVKKELWILPEFAAELSAIERRMREPRGHAGAPPDPATSLATGWTTLSLHQALGAIAAAGDGRISVELVEGSDPGLLLEMHEYGDLPVYVAVGGEQVVVEALLWPVAQVRDAGDFNAQMLRTHKLFPLSTIGIEAIDGVPAYIMFGALDAHSSLSNVMFEIETLADNVIKVTEAFQHHLHGGDDALALGATA